MINITEINDIESINKNLKHEQISTREKVYKQKKELKDINDLETEIMKELKDWGFKGFNDEFWVVNNSFAVNKNEFKEFLDKNYKYEYNIEKLLWDLEVQNSKTGKDYFKLNEYETKSGNMEKYYFTKYPREKIFID